MPKSTDLKGILKQLRNQFQEALRHQIINDIAAAISQDMADRVKIELPPPTGRQNSQGEIKLSIVYTGEVSDEQKSKIAEVLQKYRVPANLGGK